jgi:large subunit ribosomal protein L18
MSTVNRVEQRELRRRRVRAKVAGTAARPRLNVFRSLTGTYVQVIDDVAGHTLAAATSNDQEIVALGQLKKLDAAKEVGKLAAKRALAKNINTVVFDRAGYLYHGRVKAVAEGAREGGLEF